MCGEIWNEKVRKFLQLFLKKRSSKFVTFGGSEHFIFDNIPVEQLIHNNETTTQYLSNTQERERERERRIWYQY